MDILYKVIIPYSLSIMMVMVGFSLFSSWMLANRTYMDSSLTIMEVAQLRINGGLIEQAYPSIHAKNMRIRQGTHFDIRSHIRANDVVDGDITQDIEVFGNVDTNKKGIYELRLVVVNSFGLKSVKRIQILVD